MAKPILNPIKKIEEELNKEKELNKIENNSSILIPKNILSPIKTKEIKKEPIEYIEEEHIISEKPKRIELIGNETIEPIIKSLIYGTCLGDASIGEGSKTARIYYYQSHIHKEYLWDLHRVFAQYGYTNTKVPLIKARTNILKNGDNAKALSFQTYTFKSLYSIYNDFYFNDIKVVPKLIGKYLDPLALAVWMSDDGTRKDPGFILCCDCFKKEDVDLLRTVLKENFNLDSNMHINKKEDPINNKEAQYRIYIPKHSMKNLIEIVQPYMPISMLYKIGMDPIKDLNLTEDKIQEMKKNHKIFSLRSTHIKMVPKRKNHKQDLNDNSTTAPAA